MSLDKSVVLQCRTELLVVTKDTCGLVFGEQWSVLAWREEAGAVDRGATMRGDVHIAVADFKSDAVIHGIKEVLGEGLRVTVRKNESVCGWISISSTDQVCLLL